MLSRVNAARLSSIKQVVRHASEYVGPKEKCLNSVKLLGRVGQDPILRGEKSNFLTFSLATSISYPKSNAQGVTEYHSKTEWHNICVFRPYLVERMQRVKKGSRLLVMGSIEYTSYSKTNGDMVETTRIVPDDVIVLSGNENESRNS